MLTNILCVFIIPAICVILGGLFDHGIAESDNYRNDLPSTISFFIGILIDFILYPILTSLIITSFLFYENRIYLISMINHKFSQFRLALKHWRF